MCWLRWLNFIQKFKVEGLERAADFGRVCVIKTSNFEIRYQFKESLDLNEIYTGCRVGCAANAGKISFKNFEGEGLEMAADLGRFALSNEWRHLTANFEIRYQFNESFIFNEINTPNRVERANYAGENFIQKF